MGRKQALRSTLEAFLISRLLILAAAVLGLYGLGTGAYQETHRAADPTDALREILLSAFRRWDSAWFLGIVDHGYDNLTPEATAFFPLYPATTWLVGRVVGSYEWAGVTVSVMSLVVALYLLHRLTDLELGRRAADRTVLILALYPMSFYLSAIYSEALFLALSVGCVYSARRGWWWRAAALGALGSGCRNIGVLLVIPVAVMLLYGPRNDRAPADADRGRPRYGLEMRDLVVLAAIPLGLVAYTCYIRLTTSFGLLAPAKAQGLWAREFVGPLVGYWGGIKNAAVGIRDLLSGARISEPVSGMRSGLINGAALAFATVGVIGTIRRLPAAYWAYALAALIVTISYPANQLQLKSLPRLIIVLFPIFMWAGAATEHVRYRTIALVGSAAGLVLFSAMFASGYWIA